jgi:prepilin-type N-terminal cleavage/methylation domain-containing protein
MGKGFSLLEVIIALLIFSISILSIEKINFFCIYTMDKSYLKNREIILQGLKKF